MPRCLPKITPVCRTAPDVSSPSKSGVYIYIKSIIWYYIYKDMIDHIAYHTQLTEVVEVLLNSQLWKTSIWTAGHVMGIPMDPVVGLFRKDLKRSSHWGLVILTSHETHETIPWLLVGSSCSWQDPIHHWVWRLLWTPWEVDGSRLLCLKLSQELMMYSHSDKS